MINGFVIEINNENGEEYSIPLFKEFELPFGLTIVAINNRYNYDSLCLMAKTEGFVGHGFNSSIIKQVKIQAKNQLSEIDLKSSEPVFKVVIDGLENYITIIVPPYSSGFFQLFPLT